MVQEVKTNRMVPFNTPLFFGWTISLTAAYQFEINKKKLQAEDTQVADSLKVFLEGSGVLNSQEYSFYIDGPPPGPLLYCTQEQYSSLMNPPRLH
jgi:hypothetical protein